MEKKPTILCIVETHLDVKEKLEIEGYKVALNNKSQGKGGVLIAWRENVKGLVKEVYQSSTIGQSLWITFKSHGNAAVRIGAIYAPQESETLKSELSAMYEDINQQVKIGDMLGQETIIVGDFNCRIGKAIPGNDPAVSKGGRLILKMVKENNLTIANASIDCKGLWTRVEKEKRSAIDLVLTSKVTSENLLSMIVDEDKEYPVYRIERKAGEETKIFSDHNTIIVNINWLIHKQNAIQKKKVTAKGYTKYREIITRKGVSNILEGPDLQEAYNKWSKEIEDTIDKVSEKVRKRRKNSRVKQWINHKRSIKQRSLSRESKEIRAKRLNIIDQHIRQEEKSLQASKISKVIQDLKTKGGVHGPSFWEVRRKILGRREEIPYAIEDEKGNLIESEKEIVERYASYYKDLLTTTMPSSDQERYIEDQVNAKFEDLKAEANKQLPQQISLEEIAEATKSLKKKKAADRQKWRAEWILEGGDEMQRSLQILFTKIQTTKKIPAQWNFIMIKSIHKKGPKKDLKNQRGIFLASILYKLFERVLLNRNKENISNCMTEFQCGGRKGMSTLDNIMALSGIIERNRTLRRNTYLFFGDARKCFDQLWLKDCLLQLQVGGVQEYDINLLYILNEQAQIKVMTPLGESNEFSIKEAVKQGTISGPMLCGVEMDRVNQRPERLQSPYGPDYDIAMPGYVDDLAGGGGPEELTKAIECCKEMELRKVLYNIEKTVYLLIRTGTEKRIKIEERMKEGQVPEANEHQYVGLWINTEGNLKYHIQELEKKARIIITELKKIGMESELGAEALRARLKLYESTVIQAILFNLEGWGGLLSSEVEKLETIQCQCLKDIFNLPKTTSHLGLLWEVGCWPILERIQYKQLMLYHNIIHSPDSRLAKRLLFQQKEFQMPRSLQMIVDKIAKDLHLDCSWEQVRKQQKSTFKIMVKEKLGKQVRKRMEIASRNKTKLRFINKATFKRREYIDQATSTMAYQIIKTRLNMQDLSDNFRSKDTDRKCILCLSEEETTEHVLSCKEIPGESISQEWLQDTTNIPIWREIVKRFQIFLEKKQSILQKEQESSNDTSGSSPSSF